MIYFKYCFRVYRVINTSIKHVKQRRNKIAKLLSIAVKEQTADKEVLQHLLDNYNIVLENSKELWQWPEKDIKNSTTAKFLKELGLLK